MKRILFPDILRWMLVLVVLFLFVPKAAHGASQTWQLTIGGESKGAAKQAMAFVPNEIWISAGDSITWTTQSHESHTVTLLKPGQNRPSTAQGCQLIPALLYEDVGADEAAESPADPPTATGEAVSTPDGDSYDGVGTGANLACVNSGTLALFTPGNTPTPPPTTFTVKFPVAGNFKFVCLIHRDMTGVVHVLSTAAVPHGQDFYDDQAASQTRATLGDADQAKDGDDHHGDGGDSDWTDKDSHLHKVITTGELIATGGGRQYLAIMRFLPSTIWIHKGDTVEWTNDDPTEPHTVTFDEAARFVPLTPPAVNTGVDPPSGTGVTDPDNDLDSHGTITSTTDLFNSGNIGAALQDQTGLPQPAPSKTRVFVTFPNAGTFNYYCAIHDELGMEATVVVLP